MMTCREVRDRLSEYLDNDPDTPPLLHEAMR